MTDLMKSFIKTYEWTVEEIKRVEGEYPKKYKRFDKRHMEKYFSTLSYKGMNGFDFIAKLLSDLLVKHFLPNANHRTSLNFVNGLLISQGYKIEFRVSGREKVVTDYFRESKNILRNRKGDMKHYADRHLILTKMFLKNSLGKTQSKLIMDVRPISLIDSRMAASKRSLNSSSVIIDNPYGTHSING